MAKAQCSNVETQLKAVSKALSAEDTDLAEDKLDDLEVASPNCPEIVLLRGRSLYLRGQSRRAEQALADYARLVPDDARGSAYLGQLLLDKQRYQDADDASLEAVTKNPLEPSALALRGQILAMKGDQARGIALLEQACKLEPDNADAHFQLGALYIKALRRVEAESEFEKSLALVPGNASAWDYLALDLEPLGQPDRAYEAYRKGEEVNQPGRHYDGFLDYNYGRFLAKLGKLKEAKDHLDHAVDHAPDVRAVWYERAKVEVSLKDYPNARNDAEKASSLPDPGGVILDLQIYTLLEQVYSVLGETDLAKKYAELSRKTEIPAQPLPN
jgi:tetratricopeptide (TPR) repeat protein